MTDFTALSAFVKDAEKIKLSTAQPLPRLQRLQRKYSASAPALATQVASSTMPTELRNSILLMLVYVTSLPDESDDGLIAWCDNIVELFASISTETLDRVSAVLCPASPRALNVAGLTQHLDAMTANEQPEVTPTSESKQPAPTSESKQSWRWADISDSDDDTEFKQPAPTSESKQPVHTSEFKQPAPTSEFKQPVPTSESKQPVHWADYSDDNTESKRPTLKPDQVCPDCKEGKDSKFAYCSWCWYIRTHVISTKECENKSCRKKVDSSDREFCGPCFKNHQNPACQNYEECHNLCERSYRILCQSCYHETCPRALCEKCNEPVTFRGNKLCQPCYEKTRTSSSHVTERVSVQHVQVTCECGHIFNESNRATHLISNIHRNNMSALRRHQ
jgi:hypothetical protein